MDDFAGVFRIGAHLDHDIEKGSLTKARLLDALRDFSVAYELKMEPGKCTVIINNQSGTSMFFANSGDEIHWLTRHASHINGGGAYTRYVIHTTD